MAADGTEMLARLAVALAVGLLVGLERGWQARQAGEGQRAAGLRTFALAGLLGGVSGAIAEATEAIVLGFAFVGFAIAFTAFAYLEARTDREVSATTAVAGLLTFAVAPMPPSARCRWRWRRASRPRCSSPSGNRCTVGSHA